MLRRERYLGSSPSAILRLILPEMVARNHSKKERRLCQHHLPAKKSYRDNFHPLLAQTLTFSPSSDSKAPSTLQIALYKLLAVHLKYSVPPLWTIQSLLFGLS